ncbi:MAG: class I SAM-dependent methyltransferase [Hyphomicrobiaceae bacterium]|nr:class I SAM-dependent methyltransferase [Hyphomicrobiaceae bacterium]
MTATERCPVCRAAGAVHFLALAAARYWRCPTCLATFRDPAERPEADAERAHYLLHENDPADPRYRAFLARLATPLLERIAPASEILDFGCGPGPALAAMLAEAGHTVSIFDPFFRPDQAALARRYDVITCTEAAEHFHQPADEFDRLDAMLRPGGWLAIMTCFQTDDARFERWHYRLDPTHVVFYREATLRHVAEARGWQFACPAKDVALMRKPVSGRDSR